MKMINLEDIGNYESTLIVEESKSLQATINNVLRVIQDKPVIYIALIKPYVSILPRLEGDGIETDKIFFVDCVTEFAGGDVSEKQGNVIFIHEPTDLTNITITVTQFFEKIPGKKYILIDALRILTIYNTEDVVSRFMQSILEKASRNDAKVVAMTTKGKHTSLTNKVSQFFEKIMEVE